MKYSICGIAKEAGVSKSTVSRVLNSGSVSERSREAVMRVLKETGYQPNPSARALRGGRRNIIGIAARSVSSLIMLSKSMSVRLAGITDCLQKNGYSVLLINEQSPHGGFVNPFMFLDQRIVDGLIFMYSPELEQVRRDSISHREVVYTGERILPDRGFRIYMGNYDYTCLLYRHLAERGHRRILSILRTSSESVKNRRADACRDVLGEYGAVADENCFMYIQGGDQPAGFEDEALAKFRRERCTAVFIEDLTHAVRVNRRFAAEGLAPGRDFSIVAIERGTEGLSLTDPITTVRLSDYEYGRKAAEMILKVLSDPKLEYLDERCGFSLIDRGSAAYL